MTTSLPAAVQLDLVRSIDGLERAEIIKPGYAVEYDHVDPRALAAIRRSNSAQVVTLAQMAAVTVPTLGVVGTTDPYLSQFLALEPGDLINTGTPPGVGMGMKPPVFLNEGDVVELGIEKLGSQRHRVLGWNEGR